MERYVNYLTVLPETILSVVAFAIMLVDASTGGKRRRLYAWLSLVGYVSAAAALGYLAYLVQQKSPMAPLATFSGMLTTDGFRIGFSAIAIVVSSLTALVSVHWLEEDDLPAGEFYTLLMFATVGMLFMASAGDLVMIFLGLEILSIATYVMAGYRRRDLRSNEAGIKYYILGSFATAFLLYGMALTYGATKTTNLEGIRAAISGGKVDLTWLLLIGAGMMLVGLCFKIAAAPFHVWTPDVYEGAPSVVTGWMSTGPKAAAFSAFLRLYAVIFVIGGKILHLNVATVTVLSIIAVTTMIIGNTVAMVQDNIKRMLAYSSIAHAGYALLGLIAGDWQAVAFYLLSYALMNIGAFAVVATIARRYDRDATLEDYRGVGFTSLGLSVTFAIFMFSLAGFPMTAGFMAKFLVFKSAWLKGYRMLVIFGVLNSAASVYYYLRPVVLMFFSPAAAATADRRLPRIAATTTVALALTVIGVFYLGLLPDSVIHFFALGVK